MKPGFLKFLHALLLTSLLISPLAGTGPVVQALNLTDQTAPQNPFQPVILRLDESAVAQNPNPSGMSSLSALDVPQTWDVVASASGTTTTVTYLASGQFDPWGGTQPCLDVPNEAKPPIEMAAALWAANLHSSVPVTILVCWANLGDPYVLAQAGPGGGHQNFANAPLANIYYPAALANSLAGVDLNPSNQDIYIMFNAEQPWYYGTDGEPSNEQADLVTIAMHEIGHGVGVVSGELVDLFLVYSNDAWWFNGANAMAANGGQLVKVVDESGAHLDQATYENTPNSLMTPIYYNGTAEHNPGNIVRGFLKDLGWVLNYTVTFNANGGSGSMNNQISSTANLTSNAFTRAGYSFTGWNTTADGSGTAYANGASYPFTANATLYAQWAVQTSYTVTFNANGGSGSMNDQASSSAANLTSNAFTRAGYSFTGWNTTADGSGSAYADGASYPFTANTTLYAQWLSSDKAISAFGFSSPSATGVISGTDIAVTVPFGTNPSGLVATYTHTGVSVKVGNTAQVSGVTANDFTNPVTYTVVAADASTQDYTVTVTVAADSIAPTLDSFTVTSPSTSLNIPITAFSASDNDAVTGYLVTQSPTPPAANDSGWAGTAPSIYTVVSDGTYTLYPWAKDATGNISAVFGTPRTAVVDTTAPVITINNPSTSPAQSKTITASAPDATLSMSITSGLTCDGSLSFSAYASKTFTSQTDNSSRVCYKAVDAAANTSYSLSDAIAGIDTTAPSVVSVTRVHPSPTAKASVSFTVTFSEPVSGVDAADFSLVKTGLVSGYSVTSVTPVSSTVYTVKVNTGSGNGSLGLNVKASGTGILDGAGNPLGAGFTGQVYTINKTLTYYSISAQDGWVLESATNGLGGTLNNTATTFNLGDDATKKQYRGILSFNTSSIPDNATITSVMLKVKQQAIVGGGNPLSIFQGFMVDIKTGFFGLAALQATDFQQAANKTYGPFTSAASGGWYSLNLLAGKGYINKLTTNSGLTQIRLRFKLEDNGNTIANYLSLYSGNAPAGSQPQLVITYNIP